MLQIIIFSYNRASQLDLLLSSIIEHWESPNYTINVLYNSSEDKYEKGYSILKEKHKIHNNIIFYREEKKNTKYNFQVLLNVHNIYQLLKYPTIRNPKTNFRDLLLSIIDQDPNEHVMFLTDDAVFIDKVNIDKEIFDWIQESPLQNQFTLRFGLGMNNQPQSIKRMTNYLSWNPYDYINLPGWGYHFSVDAHIYSKTLIKKMFNKYIFTSPNTLEGYICTEIRNHKYLQHAKSPVHPLILSFPINIVQTFANNKNSGVSIETINDYYLKGYGIRYPIPNIYSEFQQYPKYIEFTKENLIEKLDI